MAAKTQAYWQTVINIMRGTNVTAPTAIYLAAYSALSSDGSSGGSEIAAATRQSITLSTADSTAGSVNTTEILFPVASTNWGSVVGVGLWSSSGTSGALYYTDVMTTAVTINTNNQLKFSSGSVVLQEL